MFPMNKYHLSDIVDNTMVGVFSKKSKKLIPINQPGTNVLIFYTPIIIFYHFILNRSRSYNNDNFIWFVKY